MCGAAILVAHQLAGKAARDGLFLSRFTPADLPKIVALAAVVAILLGLATGRLLSRFGPARVVPIGLVASGIMHLAEFAALEGQRSLAVSIVYLHIVGLGAVLLSGFWSVTSEVFDPREAKRRFGRIAGAGTAGGIAGGLLAERTVAWFSTDSLLLLLAALHLAGATLVWVLGRQAMSETSIAAEPGLAAARRAFAQAPFLVSLAVLVLLGTTSAALLDYLFKSGAVQIFAKGPELTRYFAIYYTGTQVLTFLVQSFATPLALEKLGLGRTVMTLALAIVGGSLGALAVPAYGMMAGVRAMELILRGSFFRSGYELFYTPIPAGDKRAVKTVIDVGCDRLGDALGAGALQLLLLMGAAHARIEILLVTISLAAVSIWITRRMDRAYIAVLERGLLQRAVELDLNDVGDSTTMSVVMRTVALPTVPAAAESPTAKTALPGPAEEQPLRLIRDLRAGNAALVRQRLRELDPWEPLAAPQVIRLLAWDEVSQESREALTRAGGKVVGQLTDTLLDEKQDFAIRRRIPRILARCESQRSVNGLLAALDDPRFEIRFQSSRALDYLHQRRPEFDYKGDVIYATVTRELSVSKPIWEGRKLLDSRDVNDSGFSFLDEVLKERANQSLEHVFSLLSVLLPREPLKTAFRALHSEDRLLRGLGFEYLASTLPVAVNAKLVALIEHGAELNSGKSAQEVLDQLMASGNSLVLELRKQGAVLPAD